jgi:Alpha/beta hydrolase domain
MRKLAVGFIVLACAASLEARVIKIVVEQRQSPAYNGQAFGKTGQFELLTGHFTGELDPNDPHNKIINDIQLAVRNAHGVVEYTGTFAIAKPIDMSKASGVLMYSVPNRGNGAPAPTADGHVSVVSGWQGDVRARENLQTIVVPIAKNADGSPVTGPFTARFINSPKGANTLALASAVSAVVYQVPATLDTAKATLTKRASEDGPRTTIAGTEWAFADCSKTPFPGTPDATKICAKDGFDAAMLYELVYTAKDPLVLGIGYAATRDFNSFLRYEDKDAEGTANPLAKQIKFAISEGNSQSGNFLRSYIHLGFNQDEKNRIVWEGSNPHIAGRQLAMNYRFAVAGGIANPYEPGSDGVLWWSDYPDAARHRKTAGMLDRCAATKTCPKIIETFGGLEFWDLRMSPNLVGTDAKEDIPLPSNVRRYYFPSTTHGGGRGGFNVAPAAVPNGCTLPANPNPESDTLRALRAALVDWVVKGTEPPASHYPKLHPKSAEEGQLVAATKTAMGFPSIPGAPSPDGIVNSLHDYDWGPDFNYNDLSGVITKAPGSIRQVLPTLVPKTDADGNDLGGVASVLRQVPLGTYVGWNVTASGFNQGKICGLNGGYIPFAKTKAERLVANDTRLSLEERYGTHEKYVALVKAAAAKAVADRFLFQEDADKLIAQATSSDVLK